MTENPEADELLAHSEDDGEWEDEPAQIESRPSGTQVISARLPTALAEELLAEATRRNVKPSDLIRQAVDSFLHARPDHIAGISAYSTGSVRVVVYLDQYRTENLNPVVEPAEPPRAVGVGLG